MGRLGAGAERCSGAHGRVCLHLPGPPLPHLPPHNSQPQVRTIDSDNGFIVNGADFVTVTDVVTDFSRPRGQGSVKDRNGHHGLWIQESSNVLMTK